ncbi:MAG: BMP family ABC transporter substrate-binding protein [Oscillospiraceae bacterium]|nr:BMP family ABC transporter substrate-binding protein [Oscillospiraceae bacterium]
MSRQEAVAQYGAAIKLGQKYYKNAVSRGLYPYPQVLDEILRENQTAGRVELGLVEIPSDLIVGTLSAGRREAFAGNFMPLLGPETEFGFKWISLCEAHLGDEGIRDPIRCYEYLGNFYVSEGNKRVSVLKSYDAPTIPGIVSRIIPVYAEDPVLQRYYEFMEYYPRISLYQIRFSNLGSFEKLQKRMGYEKDHVWTTEEKRSFLALLSRFKAAYLKLGGERLPGTVCDALLACLHVFSFPELREKNAEELEKALEGLWSDLKGESLPRPIAVSTAPEEASQSILNRVIGITRPDHLKIAFIYGNDPEVSAWSRAHIQGEKTLAAELGSKVSIQKYWALKHDYQQAMEKAVADGVDLIFATTPQMIGDCRKIAALNPKLRVLNCALSKPYMGLRTYYSRSYEAKFITGAIAGAMAEKNRIGYIANYPIVGVPADINAFALGAQMTNPRAQIELLWSSETDDPLSIFRERGISVISNRDATDPKQASWALDFGTNLLRDDGIMVPLATPRWDWGRFYVQVVRSIFNGSYEALAKTQGEQAINYWWGMNGGLIDVDFSPALPEGLRRLAEHLCRDLRDGWFEPFRCRIRDQKGVLRCDGSNSLSTAEIMRMDWLCENVEGHIPEIQELKPEAVETSQILAIRPENVVEKEPQS